MFLEKHVTTILPTSRFAIVLRHFLIILKHHSAGYDYQVWVSAAVSSSGMETLIRGSGLKTMDAVANTIRVTTIDATVGAFDEMVMGAVT